MNEPRRNTADVYGAAKVTTFGAGKPFAIYPVGSRAVRGSL